MHRPIPHPLAVAIFAGMLQLPAQAALNAVDPGAYVPANGGFPPGTRTVTVEPSTCA